MLLKPSCNLLLPSLTPNLSLVYDVEVGYAVDNASHLLVGWILTDDGIFISAVLVVFLLRSTNHLYIIYFIVVATKLLE